MIYWFLRTGNIEPPIWVFWHL